MKTRTLEVSEETYQKLEDEFTKDTKKETKTIIKDREGNVLYESKKETISEAVEEAVESEANLSGANLSGADLKWADLSKADLSKADLSWADLSEANLSETDLSETDLRWANLSKTDLSKTDLSGADFYHSKFYGKGGNVKIKKDQLDDFLKALGIVVD